MVVEWTLNVEGFGKVEEASIRISPFMIFAGDNNSGKSYIMTLLWGILTIEDLSLFFKETRKTDIFQKCSEWLKNQKRDEEVELDKTSINMFVSLFNQILITYKQLLVEQTFNENIPIKSIQLTDVAHNVPIVLNHTNESHEMFSTSYNPSSSKFVINLPFVDDPEAINYNRIFYVCFKVVLGDLSEYLKGTVFLPASRTGFMLTYKALASKAVRLGFQSRRHEDTLTLGKLTAPVTHFLSDLVSITLDTKSPFFSVAEFLEEYILQGKIVKDQSPVPNFVFKPNGTDQLMSLHITSSLVAELSPIIAFLKSGEPIYTMIIEEPEAHLHLDMQRFIARALIRLVNMGLPVWITTHSDTLVQQINNLIKLNNNSQRNELADQYGYEEIDFLDPSNVRVYQFNTVGTKSSVRLQPLTSNGFAFPTFTKSIQELTKETINFMENDDDEEDD